MYFGELIEFVETKQIFENPSKEFTERYISKIWIVIQQRLFFATTK